MNISTFIEKPKAKRARLVAHYRWCAEHEGQETLRAVRAGTILLTYHYARNAAHWAGIVADLEAADCSTLSPTV